MSHFQFFYQSNEVLKKINKETLRASYKKDNEDYYGENSIDNDTNDRADRRSQSPNDDERSNRSFLKCFSFNKKNTNKNE